MSRLVASALAATVSMLCLSGCGAGKPVTTSADGKVNVDLVEAVHNLGYIDLYVAEHQGFFTQQGINLHLTAAGGDSQAFAAVLGGSAQFALGDATLAEISREKHGDGVVLGELVSRAQFFAVSKDISTPFTTGAQFKGHTYVTSPPPNTSYNVLSSTLKQAGLDPAKDAKITTVAPGTEVGPVLAGEADAAVAQEPMVDTAVVQNGAHVLYSWSAAIGEFTNTGLQSTSSFVKANPTVAQKVVNALQLGAMYTYAHPDTAKAVARGEFPTLPPEVVNAAIQRLIDNHIPSSALPVQQDGWNNLMGLGHQLGNCACNVAWSDIVDNSFAQNAAAGMHVS
jgi:NitT/TauT family transport system substrate-binding protein